MKHLSEAPAGFCTRISAPVMVAPSPAVSPIVGAILSRRFRLVQKLGEGGMGEVFAAERIEGGAPVAVKILRSEFAGNPGVRARFAEEGRMCVRLIHVNIARVLECAQAESGLPYLVMELLQGVPLGAYMQGGARVPVAQALPILQGILSGLAAAHALGIVHRDLKPDNVFLTREAGGKFVVKLLDFGIAKVMDVAGGMGSRTRSGILLGTPGYMSPEQAKNARDADPRSDLWSAGVLFYEMLTGRPAFPAPTEYARLAALLSTEPEPIEQVDPSLTPLAAFFRRALKKNRDERFASAIEMSRALASSAPTTASRTDPPAVPGVAAPPAATAAGLPKTAPSPFAPPPAQANVLPVGAAATPSADGGGLLHPTSRGTLASPPAPVVVDPPAQVILVPPRASGDPRAFGETLESRPPAKAASATGVAPAIVGILVACALTAGLLLGWILSRTL